MYSQLLLPAVTGACQRACTYLRRTRTYSIVSVACGAVLRGERGVVTSLRQVPAGQSQAMNCTWQINVTPGRVVHLTFTEFSFSGSQGQCGGDYLVVSDVTCLDLYNDVCTLW